MNKIFVVLFILLSAEAFAESKMYTAPSPAGKQGYSKVIRTVDDAKQYKAQIRAEDSMRAMPIFEELNKELRSDKSVTAPVRIKPELLRPYEKK